MNNRRTKMFWALTLFILTSCVCEPQVYEAEEDGNFTVQLFSPNKMDLSKLHMNCRLMTEKVKCMLYVIEGEETPEGQDAQDAQFSGRVWYDRESLRQGQVWLRLTRLSVLDSGTYRCAMAANYDSDRGGWSFRSTEYFELKVAPKRTTPHLKDVEATSPAPAALRHHLLTVAVVVLLALVGIPCFMIVIMVYRFTAENSNEALPSTL